VPAADEAAHGKDCAWPGRPSLSTPVSPRCGA